MLESLVKYAAPKINLIILLEIRARNIKIIKYVTSESLNIFSKFFSFLIMPNLKKFAPRACPIGEASLLYVTMMINIPNASEPIKLLVTI